MNNNIIKQFLLNPSSMTQILKSLGNNFNICVLSHEFINGYFFRYTNIYLNSLLMMSNISYTSIKSKNFLKILIRARNNSIGIELFNPINNITREEMFVSPLDKNVINKNFNLIKSKVKDINQFEFERKSVFTNHNEKMFLCEYITLDFIKLISNKD